jgi:hypothetical protein
MANSLLQRLKTLFSQTQDTPIAAPTYEKLGILTPMAFFGFAGKTVSAEENAKITGLKQTGVLVGLLHENEERSLVFVPDRLADGSRNNAFTTLMSHAYSWSTGPRPDKIDASFTGNNPAQKLLTDIEGATTFFVADKGVSVKNPTPQQVHQYPPRHGC